MRGRAQVALLDDGHLHLNDGPIDLIVFVDDAEQGHHGTFDGVNEHQGRGSAVQLLDRISFLPGLRAGEREYFEGGGSFARLRAGIHAICGSTCQRARQGDPYGKKDPGQFHWQWLE